MLMMLMLEVHFFIVLSFTFILMRSSIATQLFCHKIYALYFLIMIGFLLCTEHLESGQLIRKKAFSSREGSLDPFFFCEILLLW